MLEIRHLSKHYGALTAIHDLSFEVRPGDVLGLLGPNGSGKTTTVKMLADLLTLTLGHVPFTRPYEPGTPDSAIEAVTGDGEDESEVTTLGLNMPNFAVRSAKSEV